MSILESFLTYFAIGMGLSILSLGLDRNSRQWADHHYEAHGVVFITVAVLITSLVWPVALGFEVRRYYATWRSRH